MNFTTSGEDAYVNTCDRTYAQDQMAKWRAWRDSKKVKLRGDRPVSVPSPNILVTCDTCNRQYSVKPATEASRKSHGRPCRCRSCVGRAGALKRHSKKK